MIPQPPKFPPLYSSAASDVYKRQVVSMFFIYIQLYLVSIYIFGLAMVLLIISLAISVYEIYISVKALEIHLDDMDE